MVNQRVGTTGVSTVIACIIALGAIPVQSRQIASPLGPLLDRSQRDPSSIESRLDGCVRLHHMWKAQVAAFTTSSSEARTKALVDTVFTPNLAFWAGYIGDEAAFMKWAQSAKPLADDPRRDVPLWADLGALVADTTLRMEQLTGRRACGEWFITYGPGWTNMGGLGSGRMVLDILGLPSSDPIGDIRFAMPHELNHLLFERARPSDPRRSLLYRIIDEGFAAFVADEYWGVGLSAAEALGYTEAEWSWAVEHEPALWREARSELASTDRKVLDRFSSARQKIMPGAPGKIGYFLGYRIIDDFVRRHGPLSWRKLYDMPLDEIVPATRFASR
jgi:hypothetical protein